MHFLFDSIQKNQSCIHFLTYGEFDAESFMHELTESEIKRVLSFGHIRRKREYIATRMLRNRIFGKQDIQYSAIGAPSIGANSHISISHSKNLAAIAVNENFKIGLDLEPPRPNIRSIQHKFLSEEEKRTFDTDCHLEMTKVWSAKEALYKLAGRKEIVFATQLFLSKDDSDWSGTIINPSETISVKLDIFEYNGSIVSINQSKIEKSKRHTT